MIGLLRGDMGTDGQVDLYRMGGWKSRGEDSHKPRYLVLVDEVGQDDNWREVMMDVERKGWMQGIATSDRSKPIHY